MAKTIGLFRVPPQGNRQPCNRASLVAILQPIVPHRFLSFVAFCRILSQR